MVTTENIVVPGRGTVVAVLTAISTLSDEIQSDGSEQCAQLTRRLKSVLAEVKHRELSQRCIPKPAVDIFVEAIRRAFTFVSYCRSTRRSEQVAIYVNGELRLLNHKIDTVEALLGQSKVDIPIAKMVSWVEVEQDDSMHGPLQTIIEQEEEEEEEALTQDTVRKPLALSEPVASSLYKVVSAEFKLCAMALGDLFELTKALLSSLILLVVNWWIYLFGGQDAIPRENTASEAFVLNLLCELEAASFATKRDTIQAGGVKILHSIIYWGEPSQHEQVRNAVQILTDSSAILSLFAKAGGMALLVNLLLNGSTAQQCHASRSLATLALTDEFYQEMQLNKVEEILASLVVMGFTDEVRRAARDAVAVRAMQRRVLRKAT